MLTLLSSKSQQRLSRLLSSTTRLSWLVGVGALLLGSLNAQAQVSGAQAIPSTDYPTLASAFAALNAQGVGAGGVTFSIAPGYTETAANLVLTATGTAANPIVFQKAAGAGANPTITAGVGTASSTVGIIQDKIIALQGSDYVTFDGLTLQDPASNTTVLTQMEWGVALLKSATPAVDGCQNVVIRNCTIALQKGTLTMGIYMANHTALSSVVLVPTTTAGANSNNKFYGNTISGVNNGIYTIGYAAPSPYTLYDQNNEIGSVVSGTAATGNTVGDYGSTTTAYGIYGIYQNGLKVQGNTVNSTPATGAALPTSILYGIMATTGGSVDILGNTVTVASSTVGSNCYGIYNSSGVNTPAGAAGTANIGNNNVTMTSTTATTSIFYGLQSAAAVANLNIFGNTLSNWSRSASTSGTSYMLYVSTGATATQNVYNNTVSNFATTGASSNVYCIYAFHNSAAAAQYYDNTVQNISNDGNTTYGMFLVGGAATLDVYRNRVSGLAANGTGPVIYGINVSAAVANVTNNLIGGFSTPSGAGVNAQVGLFLGDGTTATAQYNSIYLAGSSTGANFGTSGIQFTSSAVTLVTLRNNIVVNTCTAAGTGLTVALRRSGGVSGTVPGNLQAATNNNLYYAGTPSATNLIYAEGGTALNALTNPQQTLTNYKNFLVGRDVNAVTENPPFVSTSGTNANFLKISTTTPTQVEGGAQPISGITTDYANATRSTTPDIGAYEGSYQSVDLSGPAITGATLANTSSTANRTLVVTITDASGVATGPSTPRLYYRRGTNGAFVFVNATSVSGSQYTFTLDYALLGGSVAVGDVIQYYVAAQDLAATPNLNTSPGGGSGLTPPGTTAPATPGTYQIVGNMSGTYYVGTSTPPAGTPADRVFATLTAAANAYNLNVLTGATTFLLLDAAYSTAETFPITFNANPSASATNTLRVSPAPNTNPVVTGSSAAPAVVLLNAASNVILDGSNTTGGTTRNLTFTTANTGTSASAVIWVGSQGPGMGSTNIALRNLNVTGGNTTSAFGIYAAAAPTTPTTTPSGSTSGDDNDNLVIQNNAITTAYEAIYARGGSVNTFYDGLQIVDNRIGAALSTTGTVAAGNVTYKGIDVQGAAAPLISRNFILGMDASALSVSNAGIELNANVTNAVISRNSITGIHQFQAGGRGAYGINLASTTNITNAEISNNVVSDVLSAAGTANTGSNAFGIRLSGGTGTKVYYNAVNMFGTITPTTALPAPTNTSAAFIVTSTSATGLDVRNNIFVNSISSTAAGVASYAEYLPAASVLATSNNNDYFVSGTNGVLAYIGSNLFTLATLQTASTKDANSVSIDPLFVSNTNLLPAAAALTSAGTPVSVTLDFAGNLRPAAAPSIGAYQFTPQVIDVAANALVAPLNSVSSTCFGANTPVTIQVRNNGTGGLDFAVNPLTVSVVISGPNSSTQTLTQTISTGNLTAGTTQNITLTSLADFTPLGLYTFAITASVTGDVNTANDVLTPAPTLTVAAPVAGVLSPASQPLCLSGSATLTLAGAANGSIQFQQSSGASGPFTNIVGATAATFTTPVLTQTTYYRAQVSCGTNVVTSNVSEIIVSNPVISTAPTPATICAGRTGTLAATAPTGVSVRYYTAATGGTLVGTGNTVATPALTATTTYYAEAFTGGTAVAGLTDNSNVNDGFAQAIPTDYSLGFAVSQTGTLSSVDVYPTAAGTLTIRLYRVSGSQPAGAVTAVPGSDVSVVVTAAQVATRVTVPVNYLLSPGEYKLSNLVGGLGRYLLYSGTYPLTSPNGVLIVRGSYQYSSATSYQNTTYNSFFNLTFTNECASATRTPITVSVTPGLVATLPAATAASCGTTPYQLAGAIAGSATGATYTSSGTGTFAPNATTLNAIYTPSAADVAAGTVTLTLTPTGPSAPCTSTSQLVLSLATPPNTAFSYPAGSYCAGSATTITPMLATGAVAGTFSTTGTGLRLDPVTGVINLATQTSSGTFTITNTVTASGVCSTTTSTATIVINPRIATPTLTAVTLPGGGVQLSTNPVSGVLYQFFVGGQAVGPASASFSVTVPNVPVNGSYTVVLVVPNGCTSAPSTPVLVTATATASLNGVSLRVYPNPTADGQLNLELSGANAKASQLTVLNALGQVVYVGTVAPGTASLKLSQLAAGVYTFRVQTSQGVLTQRVVRQ